MPSRPLSSAGGHRPQTASGLAQPLANQSTAVEGFDHEPQYTYSIDEDDEEEESDAEDLFAFLPPSTADQEKQRQEHTDSQLADTSKHQPDTDGMFAVSLPSSYASPISPPPPIYDRNTRYPVSGPSGIQLPISPFPVESPPSTGSQQQHSSSDGAYQMRRVKPPTTHSGSTEIARSRTSGTSSRQVHVALPSPLEKSSEDRSSRAGKRKSMTTVDTNSFTPSMLEQDSREGSVKMEFDFDAIDEEDSPYPEVRASVSNIDDPEMPALTFRMWFIGLFLCLLSGGMNMFFNFRFPAPALLPLTLLLVSYPFGKFLAFTLPITTYRLPRFLGSAEFSFNPGPWNIKEHVLVYIMANVAISPPYAINAVVVMQVNYSIDPGFWFTVLFVLSTQLTGFGLAGVCRRFLVWPASMVWPQNLVVCTLLNTLHAEDEEGSGGITRFRYFAYLLSGAFFWYFIPGFLFQALSIFSFVCWIVPNNVPVNQLFGVENGLGMSLLTFDWNEIAWINSPLMVPWWAQVHMLAGFVLFFWIVTPILYYTNTWEMSHFPLTANGPYDRFGNTYNVSKILQADDRFNETAYAEYSPLYLPATYAMTYFLGFAVMTCILVHTVLYHGRTLLNGLKKIPVEPDDIHAKLMRNYPEVPDWWYLSVFLVCFSLGIVAIEVWHTSVPIYILLLASTIPILYMLPNGFIYAMTGQGIGVNILSQIVPAMILPGNPVANMVFKSYSVQTLVEAASFVQDLKLGHYVKVPPRATFLVQAVGTFMACFVEVGVKDWMFNNVKDICAIHQKNDLVCPHNQVFFTASAVWGLIGPTRQFGKGALYHPQLFALIVGAILPIPFWLWQRRYPSSWIRFVSTPVFLSGVGAIPPATGINYSSFFVVGFIFQYVIRKRNFAWWSKFNYVTSAAMDSGTVMSLIFIFLTLGFPKGGVNLNWWGNTVYQNTADFTGEPWHKIGPEGLPMS